MPQIVATRSPVMSPRPSGTASTFLQDKNTTAAKVGRQTAKARRVDRDARGHHRRAGQGVPAEVAEMSPRPPLWHRARGLPPPFESQRGVVHVHDVGRDAVRIDPHPLIVSCQGEGQPAQRGL